jgi:signal transduction histidine kinase
MRRTKLAEGSGQYVRIALVADLVPTGDDLAQIVHDLKNPLSSIALDADLLEAAGARCGAFDAQRSIARIRRNLQFLDRLVYDLLDACTLSNGDLALRRVPCELGSLVASVIERSVPCSERYRVMLADSEPIEVLADAVRIERVVMNLLDNALKYTPPCGGIVVRMSKDDRHAQLSISDAGPGLSSAERRVVFEPYRRVSTSAGRIGTGLGLYVSKQIVEAHGGSIGVESMRGLGARFFFELPLRQSS